MTLKYTAPRGIEEFVPRGVASGMLASDEELTDKQRRMVKAIDPDLSDSIAGIDLKEAQAEYYKSNKSGLTVLQQNKETLEKIKSKYRGHLKETVGRDQLKTFMEESYGHLEKDIEGSILTGNEPVLTGISYSSPESVIGFMQDNKKHLGIDSLSTSEMKALRKRLIDNYKEALEAGAKDIMFRQSALPEGAAKKTSDPSRTITPSNLGLNASTKPALAQEPPMTPEQEERNSQELVRQLNRIKVHVKGDPNQYLAMATPILKQLEERIKTAYQGQPELIEKYIGNMNAIANEFSK
jgi:hypothetical protein